VLDAGRQECVPNHFGRCASTTGQDVASETTAALPAFQTLAFVEQGFRNLAAAHVSLARGNRNALTADFICPTQLHNMASCETLVRRTHHHLSGSYYQMLMGRQKWTLQSNHRLHVQRTYEEDLHPRCRTANDFSASVPAQPTRRFDQNPQPDRG